MMITFIGGGNMATALISGLRKSTRPDLVLRVSDPSDDARSRLQANHNVETFTDSLAAVSGADVIILAVKPQVMSRVLEQLAGHIEPGQLVISIAAGTTIRTIKRKLGKKQAIIRSMPNTPALIGHGITGICPGKKCKPHHIAQAEKILSSTGDVVVIEDETLMDVVTAISGSGPAYYFLLTEALAVAGRALGLPGQVADKLAAHTSYGAGAMVIQSDEDAAELRRQVTSPGGTTQAAVAVLESGVFAQVVHSAVEAATVRGRELAEEDDDD
jgi:pyrroline-5-carboxylate reductase